MLTATPRTSFFGDAGSVHIEMPPLIIIEDVGGNSRGTRIGGNNVGSLKHQLRDRFWIGIREAQLRRNQPIEALPIVMLGSIMAWDLPFQFPPPEEESAATSAGSRGLHSIFQPL